MKRYLLFGGDRYYPAGGWQDYIGQFDSVVEALKAALQQEHSRGKFDWYQVVDMTTAKVVDEGMSEFGRFLRSPDQEDIAVSALGWWKGVRDTALDGNARKQDLAAYFARLPEPDKAAILQGVDALLAGQADAEFRGITQMDLREWNDRSILAIEKGSPAHSNQSKVEEFHMTNAPSVVDGDLMTAYWNALGDLGLLEC